MGYAEPAVNPELKNNTNISPPICLVLPIKLNKVKLQ